MYQIRIVNSSPYICVSSFSFSENRSINACFIIACFIYQAIEQGQFDPIKMHMVIKQLYLTIYLATLINHFNIFALSINLRMLVSRVESISYLPIHCIQIPFVPQCPTICNFNISVDNSSQDLLHSMIVLSKIIKLEQIQFTSE